MKAFYKLLLLLFVALNLQACALFSAAGLSSQGQPVKEVTQPLQSTTQGSAVNMDHSLWDQLLHKYVDLDGMVDYSGFKDDNQALQNYLQLLSSQRPTEKWSVQELLAYYINLYNAYTVDLILKNYPVKSIKDINGPWTRGIVPIGTTQLSLGGIENGVLRKMNEPRIHFAINCASISCPKLLNEAYTAARINEQLDMATTQFINSDKNEITPGNPKLSSIFDWYQKDFKIGGKQDVIGYINQYSSVKVPQNAPLEYLEYNWNLNTQ